MDRKVTRKFQNILMKEADDLRKQAERVKTLITFSVLPGSPMDDVLAAIDKHRQWVRDLEVL